MKEQIGEMAGKIWETLGEKGEMDLALLPRFLKTKSEFAYQALGWLAREDKIEYSQKAGKNFVSLTQWEREHFKGN